MRDPLTLGRAPALQATVGSDVQCRTSLGDDTVVAELTLVRERASGERKTDG